MRKRTVDLEQLIVVRLGQQLLAVDHGLLERFALGNHFGGVCGLWCVCLGSKLWFVVGLLQKMSPVWCC